MKRRNRQTPVSLFSFQDIITGLSGIMIIIVMVVILDLIDARSATSARELIAPVADMSERQEELKKEIEKLKNELVKLEEKAKLVIVASSKQVDPEVKEIADEKEREAMALWSQVVAMRTRLQKMKDADAENKKKLLEMEQTR